MNSWVSKRLAPYTTRDWCNQTLHICFFQNGSFMIEGEKLDIVHISLLHHNDSYLKLKYYKFLCILDSLDVPQTCAYFLIVTL